MKHAERIEVYTKSATWFHAIATTDSNGAGQLSLVKNAAYMVSFLKPWTTKWQAKKGLLFAINEKGEQGFVPAASVTRGERLKCKVGETSGVAPPSCRFHGATTPRFCCILNTHEIHHCDEQFNVE